MRTTLPAGILILSLLAACGAPAEAPAPPSSSSSSAVPPSAPSSEPWTGDGPDSHVDAPNAGSAGAAYESPQGFAITLPAEAWIGPDAYAPVAAFEDPAKSRVFIATIAYDDPTTPATERLPTTLDDLRGAHASWIPHWTMDVTVVENDDALARWVTEHYGPGCRVAERAPTAQAGVEDVLLEGDGLPLDRTTCVLNYAYEIRYQPGAKRVLSWELGRGPQFTERGADGPADLRMRDSVRML